MDVGDFQNRRVEDYRFTNVERLLEALQDDFSAFRETFTLLKLDERYMPRKELETTFVSKLGASQHRNQTTDTSLKILMASAAVGNFVLAIVILISHST